MGRLLRGHSGTVPTHSGAGLRRMRSEWVWALCNREVKPKHVDSRRAAPPSSTVLCAVTNSQRSVALSGLCGWRMLGARQAFWNTHGPFDGVLGFSQGCATAAGLCALQVRAGAAHTRRWYLYE